MLTGISKFVPEVMARMVQAPIADPELQRLLAFEAVRVMLTQSFNRYGWDVQRVTDRTHQLDRGSDGPTNGLSSTSGPSGPRTSVTSTAALCIS